ncbi:23S rRNA (pseudouridine(1915)-N(3))-methyltransferase RlmH, partial [Campylobacter coli]|nr:23S rRNA (pseudouridine(1915)-N(3))-methyltransferase RlmH [Campylobacter coli]
LSKLTLAHQFVKILLLEQIYRAFCINSNHPYHK